MTRHYGKFDAQGVPQSFWVDDVYPPQENGTRNAAIAADAVEITKEQWRELLAGQPLTRYVDGAVTRVAALE